MNRFIIGLLLTLAAATSVSLAQAGEKVSKAVNSTNTFEVTGMTCDGCAKGVASELRRVKGVASANVNYNDKLAVVTLDTNKVSSAKLITTIEEAGYKAKLKK